MQILIDAGKWQAGYDMESGRIGKQIEFMKGWTVEAIREHCESKGWKYQFIGAVDLDPIPVHDYHYDYSVD